eukprot:g47796.t1
MQLHMTAERRQAGAAYVSLFIVLAVALLSYSDTPLHKALLSRDLGFLVSFFSLALLSMYCYFATMFSYPGWVGGHPRKRSDLPCLASCPDDAPAANRRTSAFSILTNFLLHPVLLIFYAISNIFSPREIWRLIWGRMGYSALSQEERANVSTSNLEQKETKTEAYLSSSAEGRQDREQKDNGRDDLETGRRGSSAPRQSHTTGSRQARSMYCEFCKHLKPERSKHCYTCHRCVIKFDHHCPFVGNCIGGYNHNKFLILVWCQNATNMWAFSMLSITNVRKDDFNDITWFLRLGCCFVLFWMCFVSVCLVGFHTTMALWNMTTYEFVKPPGPWRPDSFRIQSYDQGLFKNLAQFCCARPLAEWTVPPPNATEAEGASVQMRRIEEEEEPADAVDLAETTANTGNFPGSSPSAAPGPALPMARLRVTDLKTYRTRISGSKLLHNSYQLEILKCINK